MKRLLFIGLVALVSCAEEPIQSGLSPELPALPGGWSEILGKPCWRFEWIEGGNWVSWEGGERFPEFPIAQEWTAPVLAWPFWPEKGILPGFMGPAGALFPWDAAGKTLIFTWKAGVDAFFWRELARQKLTANSGAQTSPGIPRFPWYFDWPRFRELLESDAIPPEIRQNPWLADWSAIAQKTTESGFDRRRIKAESRTEITISCPGSFWMPSSPFGEPVNVASGEPLVVSVKETPETWVSSSGLLRCQKGAWIFIPWPDP